jgi:hypothetical protein
MWLPQESKLVKIRLHSSGADIETPWAEDLGEVEGRKGARRVKIANVPFLHAKPTYEDTVIAERSLPGGVLTWDSQGLPYERINERIEKDGGRYTIILDYVLHAGAQDAKQAFGALDVAGEEANIAVEGWNRLSRDELPSVSICAESGSVRFP